MQKLNANGGEKPVEMRGVPCPLSKRLAPLARAGLRNE